MGFVRVIAVPAVLAAAVLACGCEDPPPPATEPSAKPAIAPPKVSAAPTASAPAPAASGQADAKGKMTHCPNSVTGAKTEIKDTKEGIEITVTAADAAATKE